MTTELDDQHLDQENDETKPDGVTLPTTIEELEALLDARTDEKLKGVKGKLDIAYKARDEALAEAEKLKRKERDAEIKLLEEQGKHQEAYELQLRQLREENEALQKANTSLSRDSLLTAALAPLPFRNAKAQEMALQEIKADLVRNDKGEWVHKSGVSIKDAAVAFAADESNDFLFKVKASTGSGLKQPKTSRDMPNSGKKLKDMPQDEVLKMAAEGKLPGQRR